MRDLVGEFRARLNASPLMQRLNKRKTNDFNKLSSNLRSKIDTYRGTDRGRKAENSIHDKRD
jgi:hypothetical protein